MKKSNLCHHIKPISKTTKEEVRKSSNLISLGHWGREKCVVWNCWTLYKPKENIRGRKLVKYILFCQLTWGA